MTETVEICLKEQCIAYREELLQARREVFRDELDLWPISELVNYQCRSFSQAMVKQFPELKLQRGIVSFSEPCPQRYEHWWCVLPNGEIYDPTVEQFKNRDPLVYTVWTPDMPVRVGRCMNCGGDIYGLEKDGRQSVCSDECAASLREYFDGITNKAKQNE